MSDVCHLVTEEAAEGWFFRYDTTQAPEYILLTMRGQPTLTRTTRVVTAFTYHRPRTLLPSGEICPIITDLSRDDLPHPSALEEIYHLMLPILPQLSYQVCLLDPTRPDAARLHLALEGLGLGLSPKVDAAYSMTEALTKVRDFHRWHTLR